MKTLTGILIPLSLPCQADLATLMKQQQNQPVVISEAPGTNDGSYELLSMPLTEFAQNLRILVSSEVRRLESMG